MSSPKDTYREIESLPYPEIDEFTRYSMDEYLWYFWSVCNTACQRMQKIPKKHRPAWYEQHIRYWKNARSAFRWARKRNARSLERGTTAVNNSPETFDPTI
jgi:hypothetical protein